jgi:hypothetical protein
MELSHGEESESDVIAAAQLDKDDLLEEFRHLM